MKDSNYKLRQRIKELQLENDRLKQHRNVIIDIFIMLTDLKNGQYYEPLVILKKLKPLIW